MTGIARPQLGPTRGTSASLSCFALAGAYRLRRRADPVARTFPGLLGRSRQTRCHPGPAAAGRCLLLGRSLLLTSQSVTVAIFQNYL